VKAIVVPEQQQNFFGGVVRHYPHPNAKGGYVTLCGWCDIGYEEQDGTVDCLDCLDIVTFCRSLPTANRRSQPGGEA
jgi:hypothetical protein